MIESEFLFNDRLSAKLTLKVVTLIDALALGLADVFAAHDITLIGLSLPSLVVYTLLALRQLVAWQVQVLLLVFS